MSLAEPRILFVSHDAGRTGAPIGLLAFAQWVRQEGGCEIGTLLCSPGPLAASFAPLGPTTVLGDSLLERSRTGRRLRRLLPRRLREDVARIRQAFAAGSYDVVYSNTMCNGAVLDALAPLRVPVVTHAHELSYWITRSGEKNRQSVLEHTTEFIAASQAVQRNLVQNHGVPASKVTVVYEHIRELPAVPSLAERAAARAALGLPPDAVVVGGCGAEHWRKGRDLIPLLLGALARLRPERAYHFVWVGRSGTTEEEYALHYDLTQAGVRPRFHSSGEVANPFPWFSAMDVFALLSREDPYPLACLEVAATGTPIVCFDEAGGMPEFTQDGCGLVAPYLDIEAMARQIIRLAEEPAMAQACGTRARAKVARENVLSATAPQLLAVVKKLIPPR
jgi:glycosyltransferase involved in cell wall biosynthesis